MKKQNNDYKRMSGLKVMSSLIVLLDSLVYIMLLAVINGSLGFLSAIGVTVVGAVGVAKLLGESIAISYYAIIGIIIFLGLLRGLLRYFEQYSNHYIAFRLLAVLRDKIFYSLRRLAPSKLDGKQKGSIISMVTSDIETLEVFYAHTISPICIAILVSMTILVLLGVFISWYMSLILLLGYIVIGIVLPIIASKSMREVGVEYRQKFSNFNSYFLDSIKGVNEINYYNSAEDRIKNVNIKSNELVLCTRKLKSKTSLFIAVTELVIGLVSSISLVVGITLFYNGDLSIGKLVIGIVLILSSFGAVVAISQLPSNLNQTFASGDRVLKLLKEKPLVEEIKGENDIKIDSFEIKNLSFSYGENEILKNVNMKLNKGEIVGIIGESGSGKSTLLKLLLRFFKIKEGQILYNNVDINRINTECLHKNVSMVSQYTYLYDTTIKENLLIAKQNASDEEIIDACRRASIHDFIMSLENGYNQNVGTLGDKLSMGERQRIGIARAFLSGTNIILLDEPTSNVDSINEGIILKALKNESEHRSIVLVSHRESTMAIVDRKYFINKGNMIEVSNE